MASFKSPRLPSGLVATTFCWTVPCASSSPGALHLTLESSSSHFDVLVPGPESFPPPIVFCITILQEASSIWYVMTVYHVNEGSQEKHFLFRIPQSLHVAQMLPGSFDPRPNTCGCFVNKIPLIPQMSFRGLSALPAPEKLQEGPNHKSRDRASAPCIVHCFPFNLPSQAESWWSFQMNTVERGKQSRSLC